MGYVKYCIELMTQKEVQPLPSAPLVEEYQLPSIKSAVVYSPELLRIWRGEVEYHTSLIAEIKKKMHTVQGSAREWRRQYIIHLESDLKSFLNKIDAMEQSIRIQDEEVDDAE
jgi:hypothetical protein